MPPHPSVIGSRYRIDAMVGGTASRVHRAHDLLLQRDVAIKSFPGDDGPLRWRRDGRLRERLGSGQAMEVLDGDPGGDVGPFVVMPLARAGSLDQDATAWEPWPAAVLVARLAIGLRRLHGLGAVHGAVAADAVLLDPQHGPRWAGHGGLPPEGATAEDDILAFTRTATAAVTDLPAGAEVSDELVDAVRALVRGPAGVAGIERVRAGLAAEVARLGPRPSALPAEVPVLAEARSGRVRRTVLAACTAAVLAGGVVAVGAGFVGDDGATAAAADVAGGIPSLEAPVTGDDGAPATTMRPGTGSATTDPEAPAPTRSGGRAASRTIDSDVTPTAATRTDSAPAGTVGERDRPVDRSVVDGTDEGDQTDPDEVEDRGDDGGGPDGGADAGQGSEDTGSDGSQDGSGGSEDGSGGSEDGSDDGAEDSGDGSEDGSDNGAGDDTSGSDGSDGSDGSGETPADEAA